MEKVEKGCGFVFVGVLLTIFLPIIYAMVVTILFDGSSYDGSDLESDYYEEDFNEYESPGIHWVDEYERQDGTHVKGHWRSNPDEYEWNNLNP